MNRRVVPPTFAWLRAARRAFALALLGGLSVPTAQAQDRPDPMAGARQLRSSRSRSLAKSASGITRDVGQIAIVEHDGSNYDMFDPSGAPNYAARSAVARRFYESHGDNYDFLVVFTNFEFSSPGTLAFMNPVRNDVRGIGLPPLDLGTSFGSAGRLKGYIDMAALERYRQPPQSLDPGQPGYLVTLGVLAHEVGHQWLAQVRYRNAAGADVSDLIGLQGVHWSYLLDSDASFLFGSDWVPSGMGMFKAERVQDTYSNLDLYLMGLLEPARVSPFTLLRNPALDPGQLPVEGALVSATPESVRIDQVVAAEGPRSPGVQASQKEFRLGFIFLTAPGVEPGIQDLAAADRVREAFAGHFFFHTRGVAIGDTTLAEAPAPPTAPSPDLDRATAWLLARQAADGRWEDTPGTAARDTAAAVEALAPTLQAADAVGRARTWLWAASHPTTDHAARRAVALAEPLLTPTQRLELFDSVLSLAAPAGGFGIARGYTGDALDTALALRALAALEHPADAAVAEAVATLAALRHPSGGWAMVHGGEVSAVVTAEVVLALKDWAVVPQAQALVSPALAALLTRRNGDGGFGESPSTPYATGLALRALLAAHAPANLVDAAAGWLQSTQHADGGWGGAYPTALVIAALRASQGPNLVVPQDSLHIEPPSATEGAMVAVSALVRNTGHRVAAAQHARLFDGVPALGQVVGETAVSALEAGESAPVHFDFDTSGRAGSRTLYVVADAAGEVTEAREDDNAASRMIAVAGLLPDLEVGSFDIAVSPYPPQDGETVTVTVAVHNRGQRASQPVLLDIARGDPRAGGQTIGRATVPAIPPAESRTVSIDWNTTGQAGTHELFVGADADFRLPESDETNNQAAQAVTVTAAPVSGIDLELVQLRAEPPKLATIPQDGAVEALVRNLGAEPASSFVALHDGSAEGTLLGEQAVSLGPRSSQVIAFPVHVMEPGSRTFVAVVDPAGAVEETREDNNRASATLVDGQDTLDVEVPPADVVPSSLDLTLGEILTVGARVRNRGTTSISDVPVILAHVTDSGPVELERRLVTLAPGASASLSFAWTTSIVGDPVSLAVVADPFRLLDELSEANNRADFAVRVRPSAQPNLAVSAADIHFAPDPPQEGASAIVSALVRNTSAVDAPAFVVRFFRNDPDAGGTPIGEAAVPGVAAGASAVASVAWSPVNASGNALVFAVVDPSDEVEEFDETDNRAFRPVGVLGLPDLVLTAGDVTLTPAFPRAGQVVEIAATVRNLGGQPSTAATLRAWEGEAGSGIVIGEVSIPALQPRQTAALHLSWTPSAPAGEVGLAVAADAPDEVREADEGNNLARRQVVIQNADVFLTEPFFSPDGDGRQDATTLAWRATGTVNVVVSDGRGARVRTLATGAPAEGSAPWDGRDDRGRLLWDGAYTMTVEAPGGVPLARTVAVLDTNRSPIQDAAATGLVSLHNMTCRLPSLTGPAWMPAEDEAVFIVPAEAAGVGPGLIRVGLGGDWSYVGAGPDPWYEHHGGDPATSRAFVTRGAVSPDGREVLIRAGIELVAVDLVGGERRVVVSGGAGDASWSPDGRWIALGNRVVSRDGSHENGLPLSAFEWSPDGEWLTNGRGVVRRDGSGERELPRPTDDPVQEVRWLGDGRIFVRLAREAGFQDRDPEGLRSFLIDPDSGAVAELTWIDRVAFGFGVHLTPNAARAAYRQGTDPVNVVREDGTDLRLIDPGPSALGFDVSPHDRLAFYVSDAAAQPGQACESLGSDVFALSSLQNLTLDLQAVRLPANNGLLLRGTATDRHLDHHQLEYATAAEPAEWHPIGPASAVPVVDDTLALWVPPAPGTYALRLSGEDLAGNARSTTRVVAWDRTPSLTNFAQSERLISPTGDGVKDSVHFSYLVVEPTTVEVRIHGPLVSGQPPPLVKRLQLPHAQPGTAGFDWDGRGEGGGVVPDGRYTVSVNDVPFRVDVDSTPPDLAWSYHGLGTEAVGEGTPAPGRVIAERRWHVVDPHLAGWSYGNAFFSEAGTEQVFEPERDAQGNVVYVDGVPRIRYEAGRPADTRLKDAGVEELGTDPTALLSASDHAGNRSTVPVLPVAEKLFLLAGRSFPPGEPDGRLVLGVPVSAGPVALTSASSFALGETLRSVPANAPADLRFEYRAAGAPVWTPGPAFGGRNWTADFDALALSPSTVYQARFVGHGASTAMSEDFRFLLCEAIGVLTLQEPTPVPGSTLVAYHLHVTATGPADPIASVSVTATGPGGFNNTVALEPQPDGSFAKALVAPRGDCDLGRVAFTATLTGQSGATYASDGRCRDLVQRYPRVCLGTSLRQAFPFCAASPERAYFDVAVAGLADGAVTLRTGGVALGVFEIAQGQAPLQVSVDARALPEGRVPIQARHQDGTVIEVAGPAADADVEVLPGTSGHAPFIDDTPQAVDILAPPELGRVCVTRDNAGRDTARIDLRATELGRLIELSDAAQYRRGEGAWAALQTLPATSPRRLPTGAATGVLWNVTGLPDGEYTVRLATCDRAGHQTARERRFSLARTAPFLSLALDRPVFSPNGDGRAEATLLTATITQPVRLTVEVHRQSLAGPIARHLVSDQPYQPGATLFVWDGRDDAGQIVPDGAYAIVARASDECAIAATALQNAEVDTQAPLASIAAPEPGQSVAAGVDVRGIASDPHLRSFELAFGAGPAPDAWTVFFTSPAGVPPPGGVLARWNAPAQEGAYVLRLQAIDKAENVTTVPVPVTIVPPTLLDRLNVTPPAFSPNADGRSDTATIEYVLRAPATVRLEVRAGDGSVLRTLVPAASQPAGLHSVGWNGTTDGGSAAPEGEHQVHITAEVAPVAQESSTALVLDRTPPAVSVTSPANGAYVTPQSAMRGNVHDARLFSFVVRAQPPSGPELEIGRGAAEVTEGELASLAALPDGACRLTVLAEDAASNRSAVEVAVTVDALAPVAGLLPLGAVVPRGASPIDVRGTAADANLVEYVLSFGAGAQPASFVEIARAGGAVQGASLGQWMVASLPDGPYTLRLVVTDRAGQATEARLTLVLDGTDPVAVLAAPVDGARLNAEAEIRGSAHDANLEQWTLEMAPGPAGQATQWTIVATGQSAVTAGVLGGVAPLPPDGMHTLRLTVRDAAAHSVAVQRSFRVDTTPPQAPSALQASVVHTGSTAEVRLRWDPVADDDLAGYRVTRDGSPLTPTPIVATSFVDGGRSDGTYRYEVSGLDAAGNASPASAITVRVDVTPPLADITAPRPGEALSGSVDVRGTALSADDFKEYRLLLGTGASPTSWTLLRRSSVPVAASSLGTWDALGGGPYVLALEADDTAGNTARVTVAVRVDNEAPSAPVLSSLTNGPAGDALTATWQASPEPDVRGYLLYRNDVLANATGVVVGDLRPYLLPGPAYVDAPLPDGEHCYRVVAMDQAGNLSPSSNAVCRSLDNRRPHALVVEPPDGTRFEFPLRVLADTPDRDVVSVQFQLKRAADPAWQALGAADTQAPFEVTLDPVSLAPGPYQVRAVARDTGGDDASPTAITVIYGDITAPAAPQHLTTHVDARAVQLTWAANTEADLAGYHVWRDEERITPAAIAATTFSDTAPAPGVFRYRISAVDAGGNASTLSAAADVVVYALELLPAFPVVVGSSIDLPGEGAAADTTVEIRRDGALIAQAVAATAGAFTVPAVPLLDGANRLTAQATDAAGNRSIPSAEVVVIVNVAPPAVADLQASVDDHAALLSWSPVDAPDLFGYAVARGSTDLTPPAPQTGYVAISASSVAGPDFEPERAFDGDPGTAWLAEPGVPAATWSVTFPDPVLVRKVGLAFAGAVPDYSVEALWEGRFLPLVRVRGNTQDTVEHPLPSPFATDTLRVVLSGPSLGLAEVSVEIRGRLAAATSFEDTQVPDGTHEYAVRAVDRYGAEGPAGLRSVDVGDVTPPAAPTGLNAVIVGADVLLAWNPAPEPDVAHYIVLRDAVPIATTGLPGHVDAALSSGTYRYTVVAVDAVGNRSAASAEVIATVAVAPPEAPSLTARALPNGSVALAWTHAGAAAFVVHRSGVSGGPYAILGQTGDARSFIDPTAPRGVAQYYRVHAVDARGNPSPPSNEAAATSERTEAPGVPALTRPTDADHPATVTFTEATVEGRAEPRALVSVEANGTLRGVVEAGEPFRTAAGTALPGDAKGPVVSADGRWLAYAVSSPVPAVLWHELATGASGSFTHAGAGELLALAFSADDRRLAYGVRACDVGGACRSDLFIATLVSGGVETVEDGAEDSLDAAWAPDGRSIAFTTAAGTSCSLWLRELEPAATRLLLSAASCGRPRFASDSARIALATKPVGGSVWQLLMVNVATAASSVLAEGVWPQSVPSWSHDGLRIAFTATSSTALHARVQDLSSGGAADVAEPQLTTFDPQFDPAGRWISFTALRSTADGPRRELVAEDLERGGRQIVATWTGAGATGPLALHAWTALHTLAVSFVDRVALLAAEGQFRLEGVRLRPGQNVVLARATDPDEGLTSADSRPIHLTVPANLFADLTVTNDDVATYPAIPGVGQGTLLKAHVGNTGSAPATDVRVLLTVRDAAGGTRHEQEAHVSQLPPGQAAWVTSLWTPAAAGTYGFRTLADPQDAIAESREDNNRADLGVLVAPAGGLVVRVSSDRPAYEVNAPVLLTLRITNGGAEFSGEVRTTVEAGPAIVAVIDGRHLTLGYGQTVEFTLGWNTGLTYAGDYAFATRAATPAGVAQSLQPFGILPDVNVGARLLAAAGHVPLGQAATFNAQVGNDSLNAPLDGAVARLRVRPGGGAPVFTGTTPLPRILPGGSWQGTFTWPSAQPAGAYDAELEVSAPSPLATATAPFTVVPAAGSLTGTLSVPTHAVRGEVVGAQAAVTNTGTTPLLAKEFAVEVAAATGTVLVRAPFTLDLPPGETRSTTLTLATTTLPAGAYPVFLRADSPALTLDRQTLQVHGPIGAPSIDSPASGARVPTAHPTLAVNNAASPAGAAVVYEFQLFADAALTQPLPGALGVQEAAGHTSWRVQVNLAEDRTFFWRARAGDGTAIGPWSDVGSFTVDEVNLVPSAPVPDTPPPGARVASRQPLLLVKNALDLDQDPLTYDFRVAEDAGMTTVVTSVANLPEGPGLTSWRVPETLNENQTYFWSARARDLLNESAWSDAVSFVVDTVDESPGAPEPRRPVGGATTPTLRPELVIGNATDPEGQPLTYRFEVDVVPSFDSPDLQVAPAVSEGTGETLWVPALPLTDNTQHYWRSAASDGNTSGPFGGSSFFVNLANDPPGAPGPLFPTGGAVVGTATPQLRVQNAVDPDHDVLTYEFVVSDESGTTVVASVMGVAEASPATTWTVTPPLSENTRFLWRARASDRQTSGPWSAPQLFRVNAVADPPTAPTLVAPVEGAVLDQPRPTLVVGNATSPDGLVLSYTFELYVVGPNGTLVLRESASGVAEGTGTTSFTPGSDLVDGAYRWRCRASDAAQDSPWMATASFSVAVDRPPSAPAGVTAVPGDGKVTLAWTANPEPDVVAYRVYRGTTTGGPYTLRSTVTAPAFVDTGLTNGATVFYVITALDAHFESARSGEVAATPRPAVITAQIRFTPVTMAAECLLGGSCWNDGFVSGSECCPQWLHATIELPPGNAPTHIDRAGVRLGGSAAPDPGYWKIVDGDGDGILELELRFGREKLPPLLVPGANVVTVSGKVDGADFRGSATIQVTAFEVELKITPSTLKKSSQGNDVEARLTFQDCVKASDVSISSLRLNGVVPVKNVVSTQAHHVTVKFDRAAVAALLPVGNSVEVRVTGTIRGLSFQSVDHIKVIP